jgi:hypothetical protein
MLLVGTHGGNHLCDGHCHDRPPHNCRRQCVCGRACYRGRLIDSIAIAIDPDLQRTSDQEQAMNSAQSPGPVVVGVDRSEAAIGAA